SRFVVGRIVPPACIWRASLYEMVVRPSASAPLFTTWEAAVAANADPAAAGTTCGSPEMFAALGLRSGEMIGYADSPDGYPSNLPPALAVAAELGAPGASAAWSLFDARTIKPIYDADPQFAIVPERGH